MSCPAQTATKIVKTKLNTHNENVNNAYKIYHKMKISYKNTLFRDTHTPVLTETAIVGRP